MHLIPASWSHLHILVSVFPSVGLIFALGFYVTSLIKNNQVMQRTCLVLFGLMGLLAIPTYFSGVGSMALLSKDPKISLDMMNTHLIWSYAALAALVLTAVASSLEVWRSQRAGHLSDQALNVVLALAIVTLGLMAIVGELGWEINHHELQVGLHGNTGISGSDIPEGMGTPQTWSHVHIILNHFPTVGFVFALFFFVLSLILNNDLMKRSSLVAFTICGLLGVPTYVTGAAAMWALTDPPMPGISKALINAHRDWALISLFGLGFTGGAAWIELWRYRHLGRFSSRSLFVVLAFAIITLGVMAETGHRGGQINHPEIRLATDTVPTAKDQDAGYTTPAIESEINNVIWFVPWQTLHFFGYSMIFGTVLLVVARVLGFWKSVPFSAVHRLLPLAFFGVVMNVFSGMLMLLADTFRYVNETTFAPKIALIAIGGIAALYFSLSEKLWAVKAGDDAPASAKAVAVLVLLAWTGVIMGGRLLPYM